VFKLLPAPTLEFVLPEGVLTGVAAFREWYDGVIGLFFDEVHSLTEIRLTGKRGEIVGAKVLVNWQARRWVPPQPRSEWIGFDGDQDWARAHAINAMPMMLFRSVGAPKCVVEYENWYAFYSWGEKDKRKAASRKYHTAT
jgi:hypothetical protein